MLRAIRLICREPNRFFEEKRGCGSRYSKELKRKMAREYLCGAKLKDISAKYNVAESTICEARKLLDKGLL